MPKYYFFFPKISLDIYYFLDFLTFNFLYRNWLDFELLVRNKSQLSPSRPEAGIQRRCHWQNSRHGGEALGRAVRLLGTLAFFGMSFFLCCVKCTKESSPRPRPARHQSLEPQTGLVQLCRFQCILFIPLLGFCLFLVKLYRNFLKEIGFKTGCVFVTSQRLFVYCFFYSVKFLHYFACIFLCTETLHVYTVRCDVNILFCHQLF